MVELSNIAAMPQGEKPAPVITWKPMVGLALHVAREVELALDAGRLPAMMAALAASCWSGAPR